MWLPTAEFWYNSSFHSSLGRSPFEALYSRAPRMLGLQPQPAAGGKLEEWLTERAATNILIRQHLTRAVQRMKKQTDKKRSEHEFSVGNMVYMKLQPYVQSSVMPQANQKLSFKFFGPFQIVERIGKVAYSLQLPDHSSVHPVVHVSQLRRAAGFKGSLSTQLPAIASQFRIPQQVLGSRLITRGANQVAQVRVRWSELPDDLATWEDYVALKQAFPQAPAWGQAGFQEPGSVRTTDEEGSKEQQQPGDGAHRRSGRPKKTNVRISGPEWL
jgi:hypothetical protein